MPDTEEKDLVVTNGSESNDVNIDALKAYFRDVSNISKLETEPNVYKGITVENGNKEESKSIVNKLCEVESSSISVETMDPRAKLYSAKDWSDLNLSENLIKGIYTKGYNRPSKIQGAALPFILDSPMNLIAQAHNGSGKTATFILAMLAKIDTSIIHPQCICLCPTRELARQNIDVANELGIYTGITTWLVVARGDKYDRSTGSQIIICTPGKVLEFLKKRVFPTEYMKMMVIDEADEMIDHRNSMAPQVGQIRKFFRQNLQILLFSATYHEEVRQFAERVVPNANKIIVKKEELTLKTIQQFFVICNDDSDKLSFLSDLYACMAIGQSIIFVNTRKIAFFIAENMRKDGHAISVICGTQTNSGEKMDHKVRDQVMASFRSGESKVLISTDVLSRGIDVPQVTLVINFDLPLQTNDIGNIETKNQFGELSGYSNIYNQSNPIEMVKVDNETYLHRIGRTGRFGLNGISINFILPNQLSLIKQIETYYNCKIQPLDRDIEHLESILKSLRE
ncbi:DEAD DEAH box helicase family protein [Cryptosporidium andersoni]|uniref:RNA helicase n=1 Tax=Cryptosporidium andersoni TaxID=117008 RepID=A0A1J4MTG4_9CRYT|nr:DEAD DEAH box helicase family protein [Cryptosporidium andersoni]